jgi:hypothetical protein
MHTIRLREPWEVEAQPGRMIYRRHFNRPTGLEQGDVVRLVIDGLAAAAMVHVNGEPLASGDSCWDISAQLQNRNAIVISLTIDALPPARPFGEVRLEMLVA